MKPKSPASFSAPIWIALRLKNLQAQNKNFCRVLDIRVAQVVKSDVRQSGVLQDLLVQIYDGVWVVHLTSYRRGEHVRTLWMLAVFRHQQVDSLLRNADFSDRSLRFGTGERQFAIGILHILFADGDGFVLGVEVAPEKRRDLAFPQARDQLQIEHGLSVR